MGIIDQAFLNDRVIYVSGEVNDNMSDDVVRQLLYLENEKPGEEIKLYINASPGGSVYAGLSIVDTMNLIISPVSTFCLGYNASMASVIFSNGTKGKRYMLPNSNIMIHQVSSGTEGKSDDIMIAARNTANLNHRMLSLLAKNCGKTYKRMKKDCSHDYWMNAKQAVAYGIADAIIGEEKEEEVADAL